MSSLPYTNAQRRFAHERESASRLPTGRRCGKRRDDRANMDPPPCRRFPKIHFRPLKIEGRRVYHPTPRCARRRGHTDPRQHRDSRNAAAPGAGSSSPAGVLDAAKASDLILIPCRPAILDLEAVSTSFDLVQTTGTPVFVVLNAVSPQGREADDAAATIASLGIDVAPTRLVSRVPTPALLLPASRPKNSSRRERLPRKSLICTHSRVHTCTSEGTEPMTDFASALKKPATP